MVEPPAHGKQDDSAGEDRRSRVLLVGAFRSLVPEGAEGPFGSQGGFVDTLAPAPYSLANAYLKAYAEADPELRGRYRIELLNLWEPIDLADDREQVELSPDHLRTILSFAPDIVAFSTYCWNADAIAAAVDALRAARPSLRIVIGGRATQGESEALLRALPGVDALVVGEGEIPFREMLRRGFSDLHDVPGVLSRQGDRIVCGGPSVAVEALDTIPSPFQLGLLHPPLHGVMMELSRGCLHACGYCTWNADKRLRYFGEVRIEADVKWAHAAGHRHITITDSAINYDTGRLRGVVEAIRRADPNGDIRFTYNVRHDCATAEQLELLSGLPTHMVLLGVETLGTLGMAHVDRDRVDVPALRERLAQISRAIRPPVVSIVLGLPGDTEGGIPSHPGHAHGVDRAGWSRRTGGRYRARIAAPGVSGLEALGETGRAGAPIRRARNPVFD